MFTVSLKNRGKIFTVLNFVVNFEGSHTHLVYMSREY